MILDVDVDLTPSKMTDFSLFVIFSMVKWGLKCNYFNIFFYMPEKQGKIEGKENTP